MATLFINIWDSACGECGRPADPFEDSHVTRLGYNPGEGCGAVYDAVSSHYAGTESRVRAMRPDLPFTQ